MIKKILEIKLNILAKIRLARFRPVIIGVTGNVGKSSTKEAILAAISGFKRVRASQGNLNNELGLPLSILGDWDKEYYEKGPSYWFWFKVIFTEFIKCLFLYRDNVDVLILEYGADAPGDIKRLASKYAPDVTVITAVGDSPVHLEFFDSPEHLAKEKFELAKAAIDRGGVAVINSDDSRLLSLSENIDSVTYFGKGARADIRFSDYKERYGDNKIVGSSVVINKDSFSGEVELNKVIGESQGYIISATIAVAYELSIDISSAIQSLESKYHGLKGRLSILKGVKGSVILDDTYNSSPLAAENALKALEAIQAKRKIAILGDMLELGNLSVEAHKKIGFIASRFVNKLVCVGERSRETAQEAKRLLLDKDILWFRDSVSAIEGVSNIIEEGDLILVKGSQGMRMEKVVSSILSESENTKEVLVRQSKKWLNN